MPRRSTLLTLSELLDFLTSRNLRYSTHEIPYGTAVYVSNGGQVNFYPRRGKILVQGKKMDDGLVKELYELAGMTPR